MNKEVHYLISQKQLGRYVTIFGLINGQISTREAASSFELSKRQILMERNLKHGFQMICITTNTVTG